MEQMTITSGGVVALQTVLDAILHRQSVVNFSEEVPARDVVERLMECAVTAPNHHLNQPWRFIVLAGKAREEYGEFLASLRRAKLADPDSPESARILQAERSKPLRSPVLIVGVAARTDHAESVRVEDVASTAAAIEHILLAAPAFGLGAYWRTGDPAYDPRVKAYFGLQEEDAIIGFMYLGYPQMVRTMKPRASCLEKTEWRGWE